MKNFLKSYMGSVLSSADQRAISGGLAPVDASITINCDATSTITCTGHSCSGEDGKGCSCNDINGNAVDSNDCRIAV